MAKEILIANSNKADQEEFQRIFESTDYRLIFSENAEEALLRVKLFKPDLIIAASRLSEKNGLELCEEIRGDAESRYIPFILLSNIFGEVSERDCKRVEADGVLSKPLHEIEVLDLVRHLTEKGSVGKKGMGVTESEAGRRPVAHIGKNNPSKIEEFSLDEPEAEDIIELVDVIEEAEVKMNIDDFVQPEKEEPLGGDVAPFESWERIEEMVKPEERVSLRKFRPPVTGFKLSPEEEDEVETEEMLLQLEKEIAPKETFGKEAEFFEKIELEEILEKVEQLKPSIEKEWPPEREWAAVKEPEVPEEVIPKVREAEEKYTGLEEFEAALRMGVKREGSGEEFQPFTTDKKEGQVRKETVGEVKPGDSKEEEIQPFLLEEPVMEVPGEAMTQMKPDAVKEEIQPVFEKGKTEAPEEAEAEEEMVVEEMELEELSEEEFPEELFEMLEEEEIGGLRESEMTGLAEGKAEPKKIWPKEFEIGEAAPEMRPEEIRAEGIAAEEIILEEARPEGIGAEATGFAEEMADLEAIWPKEFEIGEAAPETRPEEIRAEGITAEEIILEEARPEGIGAETTGLAEEKADLETIWPKEFEIGEVAHEIRLQEIRPPGIRPQGIKPEEIGIDRPEKPDVAGISGEETALPIRGIEKQVEQIIAKGFSEMMQEFLTKLLPEMTQNIIGHTLERIERTVQDIVPDLAEKAIREEIKRLQKEEKD